ncbi:hypothetical protein JCM10213_003545 [Rhodosporidiobolus nylandii]
MRFTTVGVLAALCAVVASTPPSAPPPAVDEPASVELSHSQPDDLKPPLFHPKVLLLRHGEKPSNKDKVGLSAVGKKRAKCLRKVLGLNGKHRVGLILAEAYNAETLRRIRPYMTVKPLADDLGLTVDTECEVDDAKCVRKKVEKYVKAGGRDEILVCWKHSMLHKIAHELGSPKTAPYPDDRYDIIWTLHKNRIVTKESEHCPGIDRPWKKGRKDPDLEIEPFHFAQDEDLEDDEADAGDWEENWEEEEFEVEEEAWAWPVDKQDSSELFSTTSGQIRLGDVA